MKDLFTAISKIESKSIGLEGQIELLAYILDNNAAACVKSADESDPGAALASIHEFKRASEMLEIVSGRLIELSAELQESIEEAYKENSAAKDIAS